MVTHPHGACADLTISVQEIVRACEIALLHATPHRISYTDKVDLANNLLPDELLANKINLYALWTRDSEADPWRAMYVGQRKMKEGWPRVRQHIFKTYEGTASKLAQVRQSLASARDIGVTGALVLPDSLRLAVEEEVINRNTATPEDLPWNEKSRMAPLTTAARRFAPPAQR